MDGINKDIILDRFEYNKELGKLYYKKIYGRGQIIGAEAKKSVRVKFKHYSIAQLIWIIENGSIAENNLKRLDNNPSNNNISNLTKNISEITKERLQSLFIYNSEMGKLYNKEKSGGKYGRESGTINQSGYRHVSVGKKTVLVHRIIWFLHYGYFPKCIDHIDGDTLNNKIENLREVTSRENSQNMKKHREGNLVGAHPDEWGRWKSTIRVKSLVNSKNFLVHLGCFNTEQEAHEAYMIALPYFK